MKRGVVRPAKLPIKEKKYRKVLPELRRDFDDRCAYCMRKLHIAREMEVDHFDPRRKKDKIQCYGNLFLADRRCNGVKSDTWPTLEQEKLGLHFLNCCEEQDYGVCIFEDPQTHLLIGTTPAARYHIDTIDLNDPDLVAMRAERAAFLSDYKRLKRSGRREDIKALFDHLKACIDDLSIPEIPAPPA